MDDFQKWLEWTFKPVDNKEPGGLSVKVAPRGISKTLSPYKVGRLIEHLQKIAFSASCEKKASEIKIGKDGLCMCDCETTCPLGKSGMALRCTKEELEKSGVEV